jgi:uncharacterized RDD family membrane protein YckC
MKCPKCGYLGFEHVDRCRNCGYDFSLTSSAVVPELSLRLDDPAAGPLDDLALIDASMPRPAAQSMSDAGPDLDRLFGVSSAPAPSDRSSELPLFGSPLPDDEPLITRASAPRQPLAVRRATPEVPRLRSEQPRAQSLDLSIDDGSPAPVRLRAVSPGSGQADRSPKSRGDAAGIGARLLAVGIDVLILAAIDAVVVYFTLQICGVTIEEFGILPKGPLIAFLLVQNVGYLVGFTAGGQTLGKMAAGIRVVPADSGSSLDLGHAFLRELMWLVLAVPAGLGFLPALFSRDHRGLHDRFAGTRVVR